VLSEPTTLSGLKRRTKNGSWLDAAVLYWRTRVYEGDLGCDWSEADKVCWNCGHCRSLQKCHIIPRSIGGEDEPSNIVALCAQCHDLSPDVSDESEIWRWIKSNRAGRSGMYNTYWGEVALEESGVDPASVSLAELKKHLRLVGEHVGQLTGRIRIKPSSVAWALRSSVKEGAARA